MERCITYLTSKVHVTLPVMVIPIHTLTLQQFRRPSLPVRGVNPGTVHVFVRSYAMGYVVHLSVKGR